MPARRPSHDTRDALPPSKRQYVAQPMPRFLEFQHARLVAEPPTGRAWLHEIKLDGYRMQVRVERGEAQVFTRRGHDWTHLLPELAEDAAELGFEGVLDGELCFLDEGGKPTFSGLRAAIGRGRTAPLVFFAFDVLWRGDTDLRSFQLKDRKAILAEALADPPSARIRAVAPLPEAAGAGGPALLAAACRLGLEGVVSKRRDSRYLAGRGETWVKAKCRLSQEFVIGGWTQEPGRHFKGLLVGVHEAGALRYVGSLERGFAKTPGLLKRLQALAAEKTPFALESPRKTAEVHWVRPELVAQAEFQEWTASGMIRHASFVGLREDKDASEVVRERAEEAPL
ncbi:non-homologous end-joining DNA ligase [Phenylobacterium sp.]|uniref:non-homologous end-joining DNA ligase n=1 Tax=Phenylobacterium sp. TaxID=1871053 RepID=UPI0035B27BEF